MQRLLIVLLMTLTTTWLAAQTPPKHEVRAAWLTTAYGLDWPARSATGRLATGRQQAELCSLLDKLAAANFNTVLFQVRIRGDVASPSRTEPYNEIFTGKEGVAPSYDPLAFAIRECHKRGMELHAWLVTIPLGTDAHVRKLGKRSVTRQEPALCRKYGQEWYLDPGHPGTKNYLMQLVREIVTDYDVDGIHFDYIRYPDRPAGFPDKDTYRKYGNGKSLAGWRRDNITAIVRHLYTGIKSVKPWVKVSSSPIGKFRDTSRYSSSGWNAYDVVYQDAQGWLKEGITDMLFPMMYFRGNGFYPFALDWQEHSNGRFIVPGLGVYFLHPAEKNWPLEEIERQINFTRAQGLAGQAYFRTRFVTDNTKELSRELECQYYPYPALFPAMTWAGHTTPPAAPQNLVKTADQGYTVLNWTAATGHDPRNTPYYIVYASDRFPVDTEKPENIRATRVTGHSYTDTFVYPWERKTYYAVTAVDRYGNESRAAQLAGKATGSSLRIQNDSLMLPPVEQAEYVILTDIGGRSLLSRPYAPGVSTGSLPKGIYYCLVTGRKGNVLRKEKVLVW